MGLGKNWFLRPGTLLLLVLMLVIGFTIMSWASGSVFTGDSGQQQENAIDCSNLDLDFVYSNSNSTHETVYFRVNMPVEAVMITFQGRENTSHVVEQPQMHRIYEASADTASFSSVEGRVASCETRVFRR